VGSHDNQNSDGAHPINGRNVLCALHTFTVRQWDSSLIIFGVARALSRSSNPVEKGSVVRECWLIKNALG
jgi:polygalacturonase